MTPADSPGLWEQIAFRTRQRPHALAALTQGGPVAYQVLVRDVDALATELLGLGLTGADMVGIHMATTYRHLVVILALDRAGIPSTSFASLEAVREPAVVAPMGLTAIVSSEPAPDPAPCRWIAYPERQRLRIADPDPVRLAAVERPPDATVRILWSSGSTGGSKGAIITRAGQAARVAAVRFVRTLSTATRHYPGMPWSTAYGYHMALAVLSAGGALVLPQPNVEFVSFANATGITAVGGTPSILADLMGPDANLARRLETVAFFDVLGVNLPSQLARRARFLLTSNLWSVYGMSEVGWVATGDAAVCIADASAVGYVIPGIAVEIVDPADRPLPAGQEGALRIRSAQAVAGYYKDPEATARLFRDGWFYPGDVGTIEPSGLVRITGRIEDLIVQDGVATSPLPLEEAIRAVPQVQDVVVFAAAPGGEGPPLVCAALVLDAAAEREQTFARIRAALGTRAPEHLLTIDRLPRTDSGKVLRRRLVETVQRGAHLKKPT